MLQHKFEIENADGSRETRTSTLADYGAPIGSGGYSSMAKLVGVPCGIGMLQIHFPHVHACRSRKRKKKRRRERRKNSSLIRFFCHM